MRDENKPISFTLIGRITSQQDKEPKYNVKRDTLKLTCSDPQIWEMECTDGTILYARFNKGELTCREKRTGDIICSGSPAIDRIKIPDNKIEFYIEMYSQHNIYFH